MRVCLLTADPGHPLLAAVSDLLAPDHQVETLDPGAEGPGPDLSSLADVYLLKARTPRALALAALLEEHGAPVLNSAAATARCQDRVAMAAVARAAGLPFAGTRCVAALGELAAAGAPPGPLVIKSRFSRRHDLVARAGSAVRLRELAADWAEEPVVVQDFVPNSGWDHKLWVVDGQLFAALRRSELAPDGRGPNLPLPTAELPASWTAAALQVGEVFGLDVYGVDILDAGGADAGGADAGGAEAGVGDAGVGDAGGAAGAPLIVDINAFPGIRGQAGAPEALAALALRIAASGRATSADERKVTQVSQK
ncbi:ATP-grasp domain-containing protein [Streptomyces tubercidicus]|uniref:ATP-grasp domain-containing protein n=1 Tax=Streptomyces tubercidicus TaxID=47759 RepID=UPI0036A53474